MHRQYLHQLGLLFGPRTWLSNISYFVYAYIILQFPVTYFSHTIRSILTFFLQAAGW